MITIPSHCYLYLHPPPAPPPTDTLKAAHLPQASQRPKQKPWGLLWLLCPPLHPCLALSLLCVLGLGVTAATGGCLTTRLYSRQAPLSHIPSPFISLLRQGLTTIQALHEPTLWVLVGLELGIFLSAFLSSWSYRPEFPCLVPSPIGLPWSPLDSVPNSVRLSLKPQYGPWDHWPELLNFSH